jgi:hypothetical protein
MYCCRCPPGRLPWFWPPASCTSMLLQLPSMPARPIVVSALESFLARSFCGVYPPAWGLQRLVRSSAHQQPSFAALDCLYCSAAPSLRNVVRCICLCQGTRPVGTRWITDAGGSAAELRMTSPLRMRLFPLAAAIPIALYRPLTPPNNDQEVNLESLTRHHAWPIMPHGRGAV